MFIFRAFRQDCEGNIHPDDLHELGNASNESIAHSVSQISNYQARNLVSQLLCVDKLRRANIYQALNHPFLTGRNAVRMIGEKAEFDVFISYRVASDAHNVEKLYNLLTQNGLKVW